MSGDFKVFAIQPLGSLGKDGKIPLNRAPEPVIELFLNKCFSSDDLEALGVRWRDTHALYSFEGENYLLSLTANRWQD